MDSKLLLLRGEYEWRTSTLAPMLVSRAIILDTSGQSPFWHSPLYFFLIQCLQRILLTKTWPTHFTRLSLSGAHHFVFSLKDNTSSNCRSQKEFISFKRSFRRCCITGLDKSSLITFIVSPSHNCQIFQWRFNVKLSPSSFTLPSVQKPYLGKWEWELFC